MMLKMKIQATTTCLLMFVVAGCTLLASVAESAVETTTKSSALSSSCNFEEWQLYHGKQQQYATRTELDKRRGIWLANQEHVEQHNSAFDAGYTLYAKSMQGPFADLEDDEFAQQYLMDPQDCSATTHVSSGRLRPLLSSSLQQDENAHVNHHPFHVDWRTKGIMTPVKSQGHCGSCWTFSTSGCLEAHVCLAAGKDDCIHWTGLAEEQLVDCAGDFNNHGCQGGLPSQAFAYLKYNGGMASEDDYPYTAPSRNGTAGTCHVPKSGYKAMVAEVFNITQYDEDDLVHAVAEVGPVSVAYQVFPDFRLYSHGIYDSYNHTTNTTMCHSGPHDVNHAVVAVGLGTSSTSSGGGGVDYYIIRNSWSGTCVADRSIHSFIHQSHSNAKCVWHISN